MKVLLLCPEKIADGRPAGVGIRMMELARTISRAGHDVTVLSPDSGEDPAWSAGDLEPSSIRDATGESDVAIVQGHIVNDYIAHRTGNAALVIDAYDPFLIENLHYAQTHPEAFAHDHDATIRSFSHGDFFLCASDAQRLFYIGMLTAIGRVSPERFKLDPTLESLVAIVPFGVSPPRKSVPRKSSRQFLFGGIYDWYRPDLAIEATAITSRTHPGVGVTFVSHTNQSETPQSRWARAMDLAARKGLEGVVEFASWFPFDQRTSVYDAHIGALLTFDPSIETDLSFRTRVLDYLWAGLPVITSSAAQTDRLIENFESGIVIESNEEEDFAAAMVSLIEDTERYERMVEGTQRFAVDYQWDRLALPLLQFCENPVSDPTKHLHLETPEVDATLSIVERVKRKIRRFV